MHKASPQGLALFFRSRPRSVRATTLRLSERLLQILPRLLHSSLGIVVGLDSQPVLADSPIALARDVKDLRDGDMAPRFGPRWLIVAVQGVAEGIDAGLVVALGKQHFSDAIAGQRALRIGVNSLLILSERAKQVVLRHQLLALQNGNPDLQVRRRLQHPIVGIDADAPRTAKRVDDILSIGANHFNALVDGLALGLDAQIDRHAKQVQILIDLANGPEALV